MCPRHWRRVPQPLRQAVNRAYRAYQRDANPDTMIALVTAQRAAIEAVG